MYIMEKLNEIQSQELIKKWEIKQELKLFPFRPLGMLDMKFHIQFIYESIKNEK